MLFNKKKKEVCPILVNVIQIQVEITNLRYHFLKIMPDLIFRFPDLRG